MEKKTVLKGERRRAEIDRIRCSFSCPASATLRERLALIDDYWERHPEYGLRMMADGAGVSPQALAYHRRMRAGGGYRYERRRGEIEAAILEMSGDWEDGSRPSTSAITDELRLRGFGCGRRLVGELLADLGFEKGDDL